MSRRKDIWWHVDSAGRKVGWMWPEDYVTILASIFGDKKWRFAFANYAGISYNSACMYATGIMPIPKHIATLVNIMGYHRDKGTLLQPLIADWLPPGVVGPNGVRGVRVNKLGETAHGQRKARSKYVPILPAHPLKEGNEFTPTTHSKVKKKSRMDGMVERTRYINGLIDNTINHGTVGDV